MQSKAWMSLCAAALLVLGAVLGMAGRASAAEAPPRMRNAGYIWRIDADDVQGLPRNFRTMEDEFHAPHKKDMDDSYVPTREGLERLHASGSGEFSASGLQSLLEALAEKTQMPICVVDLREESHGFFDGIAVSWYGEHDWGNVGLTQEEALADEAERIHGAAGQMTAVAHLGGEKNPLDEHEIFVEEAKTEKELVEAAGLRYKRIAATDHISPSPAAVDEFVQFYKSLPEDVWLHFHCQAGEGRTTEFLAMYDILKNPAVPLQDILYRQCLLGGSYVAHVEPEGSTNWKVPYYAEKAKHIALFYRYVQENEGAGFAVSWSDWLAAHESDDDADE
ncbi:protein tyrosine phosphatase [Selenomonas sputigena]|uniref:phosphatase domain-containing putative toxin n=1 Tax=Selenomonas sputigena TaxID=69823 RepID=UPI00222F30C9|nr:protein tyrosine phosphatase [Selenomonas sputigena]UZD44059.1 protein tyrosine phosphatase [Selenomonas sputigena]